MQSPVHRLDHSLGQSGKPEPSTDRLSVEYVVAALLLHRCTYAPHAHCAFSGGSPSAPYVSERVSWIVKGHPNSSILLRPSHGGVSGTPLKSIAFPVVQGGGKGWGGGGGGLRFRVVLSQTYDQTVSMRNVAKHRPLEFFASDGRADLRPRTVAVTHLTRRVVISRAQMCYRGAPQLPAGGLRGPAPPCELSSAAALNRRGS